MVRTRSRSVGLPPSGLPASITLRTPLVVPLKVSRRCSRICPDDHLPSSARCQSASDQSRVSFSTARRMCSSSGDKRHSVARCGTVSPIYWHHYAPKTKLLQSIFALRCFCREKHVSDNSQVLNEKLSAFRVLAAPLARALPPRLEPGRYPLAVCD